MPRKNKRCTGSRDVVNLSTENDFKYACLPTHEPNKHNINKVPILRSSQSSLKTKNLSAGDNRIVDIDNLKLMLSSHTLCSICFTANVCLRDYKIVGIAHLQELYCKHCENLKKR